MNLLDNRDFTLKKYAKLCDAIKNSKYVVLTFEEYFKHLKQSNIENVIILRHDIDENVRYAVDMANVENKYNLKATYYVRMRKKTYIPEKIDTIASYGHEIGYHYETLDKSNGNFEEAIKMFSEELFIFRKKYKVQTACMHGNPLSKYDNRDIWKKCKLWDFNLLGEPYLSLDYDKVTYFSDSGRTWNSGNKNKIKDVLLNKKDSPRVQIKDTDDMINLIKDGNLKNICILTHPERWNKNLKDYLHRYLIDLFYNIGKTGIYLYRKLYPKYKTKDNVN